VLRRTSGPKVKEVVMREWTILRNEELHSFYFAQYKIGAIK
jgi:hypothetical protein